MAYQKREFPDKKINAEPHETKFYANEQDFEKMKPVMIKIAARLKKAVNDKQKIIIKHHNDCDGFSSGIALDQALAPLVSYVGEKRTALHERLKRMPSVTPFYNIEDATKDSAQVLNLKSKFGEGAPLLILIDLGSGPENIVPIQMMQAVGVEVIVIDHHPVDETVDSLLELHLNPTLVEAKSEYCAGILAAEVGRMINNKVEYKSLCAISASADHVDEEFAGPYYELSGLSQDEISRITRCIDFSVFNLRNLDGKDFLTMLMGDNKEQQTKMLDLLSGVLAQREKQIFAQVETLIEVKETDRVIGNIAIDQIATRDPYPRMGIIVNMITDWLENKYDKPVTLLAHAPGILSWRTRDERYNFQDLLKLIQEKVPLAFAEGGGHPQAGTFKYALRMTDDVKKYVEEYIQSA